jgi:hypothetical protein
MGSDFAPKGSLSVQQFQKAGIPGIKFLDQGSRATNPLQILSPDQTTHGQWLVKEIPNGNVYYRGDDEAAARQAYADNYREPTRNYVLFDDKTIEILKRYGLAGLGLAGAGALTTGAYQPSPMGSPPPDPLAPGGLGA